MNRIGPWIVVAVFVGAIVVGYCLYGNFGDVTIR